MNKLPKPKPVNYKLIKRDEEPEAHELLREARYDHSQTVDAQIGLAWRHNQNPNADGKLMLGKCVKVSDLHREFEDYDFLIVLDRYSWERFSKAQRLALLDHELCHIAPMLDEDGDQKYDVRGRPVFRLRKHDLEEFREVVERHGCYMTDLVEFAKALGAEPSLFESEEAAA